MENGSAIDTTQIKAAYNAQALEAHERFGVGELYQFGPTRVELYAGLNQTPPVVRLRIPGGLLVFTDISAIKPSQDGGILIDCARSGQTPHCSINISKSGEVVFLYSPPPPPMQMSQQGIARRIGGRDFIQSSIDVQGTPEGVRVQIKGMVDAAPRLLDPKNQRSPLTFYLIEDDPARPEKPVYHEVWANNRSKQELKALKLTKGSMIEAILFRHTFEAQLTSGEKMTIIRHNLVKVIYTGSNGRGHSAKRQRAVE